MGSRPAHGLHDEVADPFYASRTEILDVPTERAAPPSPPQLPARRPAPPAPPASPASSPLEELQAIRGLLEEARWWARAFVILGSLVLGASGFIAVASVVTWLALQVGR